MAAWAVEQRTRHGLSSTETKVTFEKHTFGDISVMAEEARRRAEIARLELIDTIMLHIANTKEGSCFTTFPSHIRPNAYHHTTISVSATND